MVRLAVFSILIVVPFSPARADDCAPIAAAFDKLAAAPAYRQVTTAFGKKSMTSLAVGEKFYVQQDGVWQALALPPGGRREAMKSAVGVGMADCEQKSDQTLDGAAVKVYAYKPPKQLEEQGASAQTLWIGADGLPRRIFSETVQVELSYDDVKAPPAAVTTQPK